MRTLTLKEKLHVQAFISAILAAVIVAGGYGAYAIYVRDVAVISGRLAVVEETAERQGYLLGEAVARLDATQKEGGALREGLSSIKQRQEVSEAKGKADLLAAQKKIESIEGDIAREEASAASVVVSEWRPIVASLECNFRYANTGELYYQTKGSATALFLPSRGGNVLLSNAHVVTDDEGYRASECSATFPDSGASFTISGSGIARAADARDWSTFSLVSAPAAVMEGIKKNPRLCAEKPSLGDEIVILGYPSIGSSGNITATEGIISGFDGDYFITSAKVEQGNSGGAAILTKENCFLGIPTFVALGRVESLARILSAAVIVK